MRRRVWWVLLATMAVARAQGATETAYVTDQLRVALRADATPEADAIGMLTSGAAVTVLARDARMLHVRSASGEGWVDARYVVAEPPAAAQLLAARGQLEQLQMQLNQAHGALAEQAARIADLESRAPRPAPETPPPAPALLLAWAVSAAAMLGIGFLAGMARVRRNYRKRLGGMTLGI